MSRVQGSFFQLALASLLLAVVGCGSSSSSQPGTTPSVDSDVAALTTAAPSTTQGDASGQVAKLDRWGASVEEAAFEPKAYTNSVDRRAGWTRDGVVALMERAREEGTTILVRLADDRSEDELRALPGVEVEPIGYDSRVYELTFTRHAPEEVVEPLMAESAVIALNGRIDSFDTTPNDPLFPRQWALQANGPGAIQAPQAWDVSTDSSTVRVAVLDTGVDRTLSELSSNTIQGFDAVRNRAGQTDGNGHGTAVAGFIGALGNNANGVAGVAWTAEILPVKVLSDNGSGSDASVMRGILFAVQNGARVINMSLGGDGASQLMFEAILEARRAGVLVVAAAGNDGRNTDRRGSFPASFDLDNIVSVAAINEQGNLAGFSNFGSETVDLAAPGEDVLGIFPDRRARFISGTSFSSPITAGAAALVWSQNPNLSYVQVRERLLQSAEPLASLQGRVATGGTLNLARALQAPAPAPAPAPTPAPAPAPTPAPAPAPTPTPPPPAPSPAPTPVAGLVEAESPLTDRSGRWRVVQNAAFSGGEALVSRRSGATASVTLDGSELSLVVSTGPNRGAVAVSVDGRRVGVLDLFSPERATGVEVRIATNLAPGAHEVALTVTRFRNPSSTNRIVVIDAFRAAAAP